MATRKHVLLGQVKIFSVLLGIAGFTLTILAFWHPEGWLRQNIGIVLLNAGYLIVICQLVWNRMEHRCPTLFGLPRVRAMRSHDDLLMVERSEWLGIGVPATVFVLENEFERFVCPARVVNIQTNDLVQIQVLEGPTGETSREDIWKTLGSVERGQILIKPGLAGGAN